MVACDDANMFKSFFLDPRVEVSESQVQLGGVTGLNSGQSDAGRKDMPLPRLPLKPLVEMALHLAVTDFPPRYIKIFFHPLEIFFFRFCKFLVIFNC